MGEVTSNIRSEITANAGDVKDHCAVDLALQAPGKNQWQIL